MNSPFENLVNSSPTQKVRVAVLQSIFQDLRQRDSTLSVLDTLITKPENGRWKIPYHGRVFSIEVPERGEDGAYIISVDGDPESFIKMGVDKYARRYGFHRISDNDEALRLTTEWQGDGQRSRYAMGAVYLSNTILMMSP